MLRNFPGTEFHPEFVKIGSKAVLGRLHREILQQSVEVNEPAPDESLVILLSRNSARG